MRLCLSSDALPGGGPEQLQQACERRALQGLELTLNAGHAHGLDEAICPTKQNEGIDCFAGSHEAVQWLRLPEPPSLTMLVIWAGGAHQLGAGLVLPVPVDCPLTIPTALLHGTDTEAARSAVAWAQQHDASTAWTVDPAHATPDILRRVLDITAPTLAHVRLLGAGPEAKHADDDGTGTLMSELALRGYAGTLALAPSPQADLDRWARWLLTERGWGCNTAANKRAQSRTH